MFSYNSKHGWCSDLRRHRPEADAASSARPTTTRSATTTTAAASRASRPRRPRSRASSTSRAPTAPARASTRSRARSPSTSKSIAWIAQWSVGDARKWVESLALDGRDAEIARDVVTEIRSRLEFLEEVGLGYLTLDRAAPTLSGGEAQRIRLAAQLGSNLQGVCYVLDEPTIGLHSRDNAILLGALQEPGRQGQHAGRRRARRGDDPRRRPHHRHRPGRGQARRPAGGRGQRHRDLVASRFGHRPLPGPAAGPSAAAAPAGRAGDGGDRAQGERRPTRC